MKRCRRSLLAILAVVLLPTLLLWGCSGSSSGSGGTTVRVSLASSSADGGVGDGASLAPSKGGSSLPDHAWITVTKVALLPADGSAEFPDPEGEEPSADGPSPHNGVKVSATLPSPVEVDLLALPSQNAAFLLDAIESVPAGRYGKLRLYYRDPKVHFPGAEDNAAVHGTANYHLDLHFTGGALDVPASTDADVRVVNVSVVFVLGADGLKINVKPGKVLMRPQVFCTVGGLRYMIRGTAGSVDGGAGTFSLLTSTGRTFPASWGSGTLWSWTDNGTVPSRTVAVSPAAGAGSLRNTAFVTAVGTIDGATGAFSAEWISIIFPCTSSDTVLLPFGSGNAFTTGTAESPFLVVAAPSKEEARYDDPATLAPYADGWTLVLPGVTATARGYAFAGGVEAYWISLAGTPASSPETTSALATGTTGTFLGGQSFNETRGVTVTVEGPYDRAVSAMTLAGLNVVGDGATALVGARIYDGGTGALVASGNVTVSSGTGLSVTVPISATLGAGRTYRACFYIRTTPLWRGSCTLFVPDSGTLPYVESTGVFRVFAAHAFPADAFPTNVNAGVPLISIVSSEV